MADFLTVDTNVLVYALDERDQRKHSIATGLIAGLVDWNARLTTIAIGEFFVVAARKFTTPAIARRRAEAFCNLVPVVSYEPRHILRAAAEVEAGRFAFWDAVMLASAEDAGCTICLSEDMADGARLGKITVKNPFGARGLNEEVRAFLERD